MIDILKKFEGTTLVCLSLAGCLRAIANDNKYAKELARMGAKDVLTACQLAHKDNDRLRAEVAAAIQRFDDAAAGMEATGRESQVKATKSKVKEGKKVKPGEVKGNFSSRLGKGGEKKDMEFV